MARIRVEEKKRGRSSGGFPWGWIIGLIVIALAAWFLIEAFDDDPMEENLTTTETVEEGYDDPAAYSDRESRRALASQTLYQDLERFEAFVEESEVEENPQQYISEGLNHLVAAISAVNTAGEYQTANFERETQEILSSLNQPQAGSDAASVKASFLQIAGLLQSLQQNEEDFLDLDDDIEDVVEAAEEIDEGQLLSDQTEQIEEFFEAAEEALESMSDEVEAWVDMASANY